MTTQKISNRRTSCRKWWVAAAAVAALALAGCANDSQALLQEPAPGDAQEVTVLASPDTTVTVGVATWHYRATSEGIIVRGLAADMVPRARFWIAAGETTDELTAHSTDTGATVSILRKGDVRGDDAALRNAVAAFRVDAEAAQVPDKNGGSQNVNDNVGFCLGDSASFGTWSFWGTTHVQMENWSDTWIKFSFQAGAGYEENWIPPWQAPTFGRQWAAFPVRISYIEFNGPLAPCPVQVHVW